MKNIKLLAIFLALSINLFSQGQDYNPPDSSSTFDGYWSNIHLLGMKDSVSPFNGLNQNWVKIYTPTFQLTRFKSNRNDGVPTSIYWGDANGYFKRSPISSLSIPSSSVSGLSTVATTGNYNDLSNKPVITTYTAGTGISISGTTITNNSPNQVVNISGSGNTSISGTYPNYTVSSSNTTSVSATAPLSVTSGTAIAIVQSNSVTAGYLSSTEWNTFNSKQGTVIAGNGISITANTIVNTLPDQTVSITGGTGITINSSYPNFTITPTARTYTNTIRPLVTTTISTGFQISTTKDYNVNYSVDVGITSLLIGTNSGQVFLEISSNNSSPWTILQSPINSINGVVETLINTQSLSGFIPAGYYVRLG